VGAVKGTSNQGRSESIECYNFLQVEPKPAEIKSEIQAFHTLPKTTLFTTATIHRAGTLRAAGDLRRGEQGGDGV